jgi:hypothetical protein
VGGRVAKLASPLVICSSGQQFKAWHKKYKLAPFSRQFSNHNFVGHLPDKD